MRELLMDLHQGNSSIGFEQKSPICPQRVSAESQPSSECLIPRRFEASTILKQLILTHRRWAEFNAAASLLTSSAVPQRDALLKIWGR